MRVDHWTQFLLAPVEPSSLPESPQLILSLFVPFFVLFLDMETQRELCYKAKDFNGTGWTQKMAWGQLGSQDVKSWLLITH